MNDGTIRHLDLFAGIGGFSIASDTVFGNVEHTFVEWDGFCQSVLKKHWPQAEIHSDIRQFIAETERQGLQQRTTDKAYCNVVYIALQ